MSLIRKTKMKKDKKGFTLVELIVVLVILAILAAIAIPTFNGYIKKAKEKVVAAEARTVLLAADTIIAEQNETGTATTANATVEKIAELAGVTVTSITNYNVTDGNLTTLEYHKNDIIYEYKPDNSNMQKQEPKKS